MFDKQCKAVFERFDSLINLFINIMYKLLKIEIFLFFETTSLYLVYWQIIGYARCRFQKHNFFYFLKVGTAKEEAIEATGTDS